MGFGDSFNKLKQFGLQKAGKAEARKESDEFLLMVNQMKATKKELQNLLEATKKLNERQYKIIQSYEATGNAFTSLTSTETRPQLTAMPALLTKNAQAQRVTAEAFRINIVDALESIVAVHVKAAEDAEKALNDARLDADAKLASYQSAQSGGKAAEVDAAKRKSDEAENVYTAAKNALEGACARVAEAKENFLTEKLNSIVACISAMGDDVVASAREFTQATQ